MNLKKIVKEKVITGIIILTTAVVIVGGIEYFSKRSIKLRDERTESGYVIPSKLKVPLFKDLNENRKNEVLMEYKGKFYLLIEDEQGNPVIKQYATEPNEMKINNYYLFLNR